MMPDWNFSIFGPLREAAQPNVYTQSAGLITRLGFISNGISEVQFVDLKTADGRIIHSRVKE